MSDCDERILLCVKYNALVHTGVFTIEPLGPWPHFAKNATKMRHFQAKISKIFWGGAIAPSPDPTPTGEGNTSDQTDHPRRLRRFTSTPSNFFLNFYHNATLR